MQNWKKEMNARLSVQKEQDKKDMKKLEARILNPDDVTDHGIYYYSCESEECKNMTAQERRGFRKGAISMRNRLFKKTVN